MNKPNFSGMNVTVMGLGLHGGGIETTRFLVNHGANVTATDLRGPDVLQPAIKKLDGLPVRYVLGEHREEDFSQADLVIKNPAVKRNNKYLQISKKIHTDISLFLEFFTGPVLTITGSKGKSSTASALAYGLKQKYPLTRLGGNITVSPLSFADELNEPENTPVVLELSSFQLGDLALTGVELNPLVSLITNIHRDHQDYYNDMNSYVADKMKIFEQQDKSNCRIFFADQESWTNQFLLQNSENIWLCASNPEIPKNWKGQEVKGWAWIEGEKGWLSVQKKKPSLIVPNNPMVPGNHQKMNLLFAGIVMFNMGMSPEEILEATTTYPGIPHRMEFIGIKNGIKVYNDSAATIPESVLAGVQSFSAAVHLITGGTDKNLEFHLYKEIQMYTESITLLDGTATPIIAGYLDKSNEESPHRTLESAVEAAFQKAKPGDVVVLSPGCASFGMFQNEFDRGNQFRVLIQGMI